MEFSATGALPIVYTYLDWFEQQIDPITLNDTPLPAATLTYPPLAGLSYPQGGVFTLVFPALQADEIAWLTTTCLLPVTLTVPDITQPGVVYVRASGQGVFTSSTLTLSITLTIPVKLGWDSGPAWW